MTDPEVTLPALLSHWSNLEPDRCRSGIGQFEVCYQGQWLPASEQPEHHGPILAAVLGGCEAKGIVCEISYSPGWQDYPPEIQVGCLPNKWVAFLKGFDTGRDMT